MSSKFFEVERVCVFLFPRFQESKYMSRIDLRDVMEMIGDTASHISRLVSIETLEKCIRHTEGIWDLGSPGETRTTSLTRETSYMVVRTLGPLDTLGEDSVWICSKKMPYRKLCTKSFCYLSECFETLFEMSLFATIERDKGTIWSIDKIPEVIIVTVWIEFISEGLEEEIELHLIVSLDESVKLVGDMIDPSLEFE
jgi:hypothetical protein